MESGVQPRIEMECVMDVDGGLAEIPMSAAMGPTVWTASSLREHDWVVQLTPEDLNGLESLPVRRRGDHEVEAEPNGGDLKARPLRRLVREMRQVMDCGPGLVLLRGLPVDKWREEVTRELYVRLSSLIDSPRCQNAAGDLTHVIRDEGAGSGRSQSNDEITYHTDVGFPTEAHPVDPPRYLGLLCLRNAKEGGASLVVSGHAVHNRIMRDNPGALRQLYRGYPFGGRPGSHADGRRAEDCPIFQWVDAGLQVRYNRHWIDVGENANGQPVSDAAGAALDVLDEVLAAPGMSIRFVMEPGDLLMINNRVVLHSREAFVDHEDPRERRTLFRLWAG
jgi:alpha-ketoglutarate-dependent taurine dioxygenase